MARSIPESVTTIKHPSFVLPSGTMKLRVYPTGTWRLRNIHDTIGGKSEREKSLMQRSSSVRKSRKDCSTMSEVISSFEHVTPAWLTEILRAKRYLPRGQVTAIEKKETSPTITSLVVRFVLHYSPDAPETAPRRMFMKMSKSGEVEDFAAHVGPKEVAFYNGIAGTSIERWVPHCYSAAYSVEADTFHLLLQDLAESHCHPYNSSASKRLIAWHTFTRSGGIIRNWGRIWAAARTKQSWAPCLEMLKLFSPASSISWATDFQASGVPSTNGYSPRHPILLNASSQRKT